VHDVEYEIRTSVSHKQIIYDINRITAKMYTERELYRGT
jgi:hypothetical protein